MTSLPRERCPACHPSLRSGSLRPSRQTQSSTCTSFFRANFNSSSSLPVSASRPSTAATIGSHSAGTRDKSSLDAKGKSFYRNKKIISGTIAPFEEQIKRSELALAPPPYLRQHIASIPLKKGALIRMGRMEKEVIEAQFNILHSESNMIFRVRRDTR